MVVDKYLQILTLWDYLFKVNPHRNYYSITIVTYPFIGNFCLRSYHDARNRSGLLVTQL